MWLLLLRISLVTYDLGLVLMSVCPYISNMHSYDQSIHIGVVWVIFMFMSLS